jgi:hypothetical protein
MEGEDTKDLVVEVNESEETPGEGPFLSPKSVAVRARVCNLSGVQVNICKEIEREGLPLARAAALHGISAKKAKALFEESPDFQLAVEEAEARCIKRILGEMMGAKDNWKSTQARTWFMERRFRDDFGNKAEVNHNVSGEVLLKAIGPESAKSLQDRRSKLALCQDAIEVEPVKQPDNSP